MDIKFRSYLFLLFLSLSLCSNNLFAKNWLYEVHHLVSDGATAADYVDPNLVNPWGLVFGPNLPVWIANNGTNKASIYHGSGAALPLVVNIPTVAGAGSPTGIVFNDSNAFVISAKGKKAPAKFIFATESGTLSGWSPLVDKTNAVIAVNNSASANYKGLAIGADGTQKFLYATNFKEGKVDIFDQQFNPVLIPDAFVDPHLPKHYSPFGIQNINGDIYVTYAVPDKSRSDAVSGLGLGVVNVFDASGKFLHRVATGGFLNAPWGVTLAPASFGYAQNKLLIANFGDGRINVYSPSAHIFLGQLWNADMVPIVIEGLWGIAFGNGAHNQPTSTLYFTAGIQKEMHGLYGRITPAK